MTIRTEGSPGTQHKSLMEGGISESLHQGAARPAELAELAEPAERAEPTDRTGRTKRPNRVRSNAGRWGRQVGLRGKGSAGPGAICICVFAVLIVHVSSSLFG